jgi:hypothetical protein
MRGGREVLKHKKVIAKYTLIWKLAYNKMKVIWFWGSDLE